MDTPFFPSWRARLAAFGQRVRSLRVQPLPHLEKLFSPILPAGLLAQAESGANSRERFYPLRCTFWGFLWQALNPGAPGREAARQIQALFGSARQTGPVDKEGSAFARPANACPCPSSSAPAPPPPLTPKSSCRRTSNSGAAGGPKSSMDPP